MKSKLVLFAMLYGGLAAAQNAAAADLKLDEIVVNSNRIASEEQLDQPSISKKTSYVSDTAELLRDLPGVSVYSAGGVSNLPVVHGLADDRLRIKVDGMDLVSSCPNHMNSPLSYVDPSKLKNIKVYTGVTPVSVGGDSIGAAIIAQTKDPEFAAEGKGFLATGELGSYYRSNGNAYGVNAGALLATEKMSLTYDGAFARSGNYTAGGNFKNYTYTGRPGHELPLNEVGSTAYEAQNHAVGIAFKNGVHLYEAKLGYQFIPKELYPNQRMDMLDNKEKRINLRYFGQFDQVNFEARAYYERVDHYMDFGADKQFNYGTPPGLVAPGMPMYTKGETFGVGLKSEVELTKNDTLRTGFDMQLYTLDDWWPPSPDCGVGNCIGGMAPLTFWNINGGKRDRYGIYGEWDSQLNREWQTQAGLRAEIVNTDTGPVVGYNTSTTPLNTGMMKDMYERSSVGSRADFNSMDRSRTDYNIDWVLSSHYTPNTTSTYDFGFTQKMRSPNLYERYSWSRNTMALEMNNFVGDGNGYLGNPDLRSERAYTLSITGDWYSADRAWEIKASPYFSYVADYIDAVQWDIANGNNKPASPLVPSKFVMMKYMNQTARIFGLDVSGQMPLGSTAAGDFGLRGFVSYTNGENTDTGYALYNVMPLNAKGVFTHKLYGWDNALEFIGVLQKHNISVVRNETQTASYGLVNFRTSYTWKFARLDFGVENIFDRQYSLPQGGAYTGQGATMSFNKEINGASMWGTPVPGMGRSFYVGLNLKF